MEDIKLCERCNRLTEQEYPHEHLKLISSIPESSIFRCTKCQAFWICDIDEGWENLSFETLWGIAQ